jgi:hypothetical protein
MQSMESFPKAARRCFRNNGQRIPGYGVTRLELVFGVSAFPHAD